MSRQRLPRFAALFRKAVDVADATPQSWTLLALVAGTLVANQFEADARSPVWPILVACTFLAVWGFLRFIESGRRRLSLTKDVSNPQ